MKSKYLLLWLLLVVALGTVTAVSFSTELTVLGVPIKRAPIAENLTGGYKTTEEEAAAQQQAKAQAARKAAPQKAPLDTATQTILVFGDSMTQNIALRLAAYARANGHKINAVNWDSSGTRLWSSVDTLDAFIRKFHPTYAFISLGGNEAGAYKPEAYAENVMKIVGKLGKIPFVWVGPPSLKADRGFSDMLQRTLPAGTFFRSDSLELPRRKDRIHPTAEGAAIQIDSLARWMANSAAHPIRMAAPADSMPKPTLRDLKITYLKARRNR